MSRSLTPSLLAAALSLAALAPFASATAASFQLTIFEATAELQKRTDTGDAGRQYWANYARYGEALQAAGVLRGGAALQPDTQARRVARGSNAAPAPASVQMGGYFVIDVPTMEDALAWAAKAPAVTTGGAVDVRPLVPMPPTMR